MDTSKIATYLREKGHGWRITRRPQDNGYVENKNDYIERACLDDERIVCMDKALFMEHVDEFVQRNNVYLK